MTREITKPTWIIHLVFDPEGKREGIVCHTHGLDKYGSLELELNLSLSQEKSMQFLNIIGFAIANGKKFKDGDFDESLFNCKIAFKEVEGIDGDGGKKLRVIFPDRNFKFPWDEGCEEPYKSQI